MNLVITGHVDHGKSTVIGRLMADTKSLPDGKLEQVKASCIRNSKPFEYAFLLDALKDEQNQGITIDSARVFFKTKKRHYIIIDAPGHIEFLKNMITGASRAEAAFLCIGADEGIQENSRRHGYMLSMLGIKQLGVLVNKMDLVHYDQRVYRTVTRKFSRFLRGINIDKITFLPVSGREGDNIVAPSKNMPWWKGETVLSLIDSFKKEKTLEEKAFRMPIQDVYKFNALGDNRRIVAGTISSGRIRTGDELIFYPSGKKSRVAKIEIFSGDIPESASVGMATGISLSEQVYVKRGDLAVLAKEQAPQSGNVIRVNLFWLGRKPFVKEKEYILKIGADRVRVRLSDIIKVINSSDLSSNITKNFVARHEVADCVLTTKRVIAFDLVEDLPQTSRFVIVDDYEIAGGGTVHELIHDKKNEYRNKVRTRNIKWDTSNISRTARSEAYGHKPALILVGGPEDSRKAHFAKSLEERFFSQGRTVYYLGISNLLIGLDKDMSIRRHHLYPEDREEMIRRLVELTNILMDVGIILIATVSDLSSNEQEDFALSISPEKISTIWIGNCEDKDINLDYIIEDVSTAPDHVDAVMTTFAKNGIGK